MSITQNSSVSFPARTVGDFWSWIGSPNSVSKSITATATRTRTGERLPHHKQIIASGGNATTPLSARYETVECSPANTNVLSYWDNVPYQFWTGGNTGDLAICNGQTTRNPRAPTLTTDFVENLARAAFYKKLRELSIQMSGPTFLGELRETLRMLRRPAAALHDSANGYLGLLRKRKRSDPRNWMKAAGGLWLEASFGWKPLINDVRDAIKAYERTLSRAEKKVISVGKIKEYDISRSLDGGIEGNQTAMNYWQGILYSADIHLYETHFVRFKGAIKARAEATQWDNYALFGFTPAEFIPTAWELLPWSFLADYFTNIGDILSSTTTSTADVQFVNKTLITKTTYFGTLSLNASATNALRGGNYVLASSSGSGGSFKSTRRDVTRIPNSGISLPRFQFSLGLSDGQLGNIAALLTQARALHPQNPFPSRWNGHR